MADRPEKSAAAGRVWKLIAARAPLLVAISLVLGLAFNAKNPNRIPLVQEPTELQTGNLSPPSGDLAEPEGRGPRLKNVTKSVVLIPSKRPTGLAEEEN
jgi:hypothetical protein